MEKQRAGEEEREKHPETERERLRERISRMVHILLIFGISVNIQSIKTTIISHIRVQASNMTFKHLLNLVLSKMSIPF